MRKIKKKYRRPFHPWEKERIEEEKLIMKEYGFKNKKEIWKINSILKKIKDLAKKLIASTGKQAELEKAQLFARLERLGLIAPGARLDDILTLEPKQLYEKRLQTLVFKKGLAKTIKQARQCITHKHIAIGDKIYSSPNYLVPKNEEPLIGFAKSSVLAKK